MTANETTTAPEAERFEIATRAEALCDVLDGFWPWARAEFSTPTNLRLRDDADLTERAQRIAHAGEFLSWELRELVLVLRSEEV